MNKPEWQPDSERYPGFQALHGVEAMPPFLMSVVSNDEGWCFATSAGAFTAGRVSPEGAIFPYQTADKLLERPEVSGVMSVVLIEQDGRVCRWEPWRNYAPSYSISRSLYKHRWGSELIFEETNHDLALRWIWRLGFSARYGWVRAVRVESLADKPLALRYLDGWLQLSAPGVSARQYATLGYLAAAYLRHELVQPAGLGLFALNAKIIDRPVAAESLRAHTAWSVGHREAVRLLSTRQVELFRAGGTVQEEREVRGDFGSFLTVGTLALAPGAAAEWTSAVDSGLDHAAILRLCDELAEPGKLAEAARAEVAEGTRELGRRLASADALQQGGDEAATIHHAANVLFNCMRGGVLSDGYHLPSVDFRNYLASRNRDVAARVRERLDAWPERVSLDFVQQEAQASGDAQFQRLVGEYLPLTFSRRHGDPSRPWNTFTISVKDGQGHPKLGYQGNWRDIFQNWEALAFSFPGWLGNMVSVFLNASTAEGYNPYRVLRQGVDWEVENPEDPWSHIGYWGDHQIVYLLKLLEALENTRPEWLAAAWRDMRFSCVEVPYRIKPFAAVLADPRHSIEFDEAAHTRLMQRAAAIGGDGKLLADAEGEPMLFSLIEKLLIPALVKLTNWVPGGGIWMNTQRPEWNDANNALAGWGLSLVTVAYLRRYLEFLGKLAMQASDDPIPLRAPTARLLEEVTGIFHSSDPKAVLDPAKRLHLMSQLGRAGEKHRHALYAHDLNEIIHLPAQAVQTLVRATVPLLDSTLWANRRPDGLFHSYNVLHIENGEKANIEDLDLMLEGQVALLASGMLAPKDGVEIATALRHSALYRPDQHSYLLYPDRELTPFLDRNRVARADAIRIPLVGEMLAGGERSILADDAHGHFRFNADFANADDLRSALDKLAGDPLWTGAVQRDGAALLELWEKVFHHRQFTGRSATFFSFEGLGCVYWHMVAKLLLAIQELHAQAVELFPINARELTGIYNDIQSGLGYRKGPESYGAFPPDPYSHTPRHRGAQQPGMTGQVKEEILTRWGEFGVSWKQGLLTLKPALLRASEFRNAPHTFNYVDVNGAAQTWNLPANSLAFTLAQVPVCYHQDGPDGLRVERSDGTTVALAGNTLDEADSQSIQRRDGKVRRLSLRWRPPHSSPGK